MASSPTPESASSHLSNYRLVARHKVRVARDPGGIDYILKAHFSVRSARPGTPSPAPRSSTTRGAIIRKSRRVSLRRTDVSIFPAIHEDASCLQSLRIIIASRSSIFSRSKQQQLIDLLIRSTTTTVGHVAGFHFREFSP